MEMNLYKAVLSLTKDEWVEFLTGHEKYHKILLEHYSFEGHEANEKEFQNIWGYQPKQQLFYMGKKIEK